MFYRLFEKVLMLGQTSTRLLRFGRYQIYRLLNALLSVRYPLEDFRRDQVFRFEAAGLDYLGAASKVDDLYAALPEIWESSEHHKVFAGLAAAMKPFPRCLEIGTYSGKGAMALSQLFPESEIVTIDLPDSDPLFISSYSRGKVEALRAFLVDRDRRLAGLHNVRFEQCDSLSLTIGVEKFDLIWVDGAHNLPTVAVDIANSIRMLNPGGYIAVDDVYISGKDKNVYESVGAFRTISAFEKAGLIVSHLVHKRLAAPHVRFPGKYIAILQAAGRSGSAAASPRGEQKDK